LNDLLKLFLQGGLFQFGQHASKVRTGDKKQEAGNDF